MATRPRELLAEFFASASGRVGTLFLAILVIISLGAIVVFPLDFGVRIWNDPSVWADNPGAAPPAWAGLLSDAPLAEHRVYQAVTPSQKQAVIVGSRWLYAFRYELQGRGIPSALTLTLAQLEFFQQPPTVSVSLHRPDARTVELTTLVIRSASPTESPPFRRHFETPLRLNLNSDPAVLSRIVDFARQQLSVNLDEQDLLLRGAGRVLFGTPRTGEGRQAELQPLPGSYRVEVNVSLSDPRDQVGLVKVVVGGAAFGLMGTDALGRDLAIGLVFGFPVALFIGVVTATLTTALGTLTGIVSGYYGGKTDTTIQRLSDVFSNIPLLPILIFLAFIFGQKLFIVILILVVFGWPGLAILLRSMVLQIREGQFIESAVVLGAPARHIMLRHIFPQTAPFVFAQMIFFTPSAILAEASLSFLGLGDPSIPTWGQILQSGFQNGGVYLGYWWWVLPPGLLIVAAAMVFVLLAVALEPVVNPRLRRRG